MVLEVDLASNRNEYQEYFLGDKGGRCVELTTLPPSCADCLEMWEPHTPGTLRACPGMYRNCFTFNLDGCIDLILKLTVIRLRDGRPRNRGSFPGRSK